MFLNHPNKINTSLDNYYLEPYKYNPSEHITNNYYKYDDLGVNNELGDIVQMLTSIIMSNGNQSEKYSSSLRTSKITRTITTTTTPVQLKSNVIFRLIANNNINELQHVLTHNNINLDNQDEDGDTPLHIAVFLCNYNACKLLIENGSNIFIKDKWGQTPLHRICFCVDENDIFQIVELFEERQYANSNSNNSIFNMVDNFGNTPFHLVLKYFIKNNVEIKNKHIRLIAKLKKITDNKIKNNDGETISDIIKILDTM